MKTFKQFLMENSNVGNYVAINCQDLSDFFELIGIKEPVTGEAPPKGDYHCTLMYSTDTDIDTDKILKNLQSNFTGEIEVDVLGVDCFDSLPKDGSRDEEKSCLVLKLDSAELNKIHIFLKNAGLNHSYKDYSPHVTLRYNMSIHEAHYYRDKINDMFKHQHMEIELAKFKSQRINKNYV